MKDDRVYLQHILDEITFLRRISEGKSLNDLIHDNYYSHAVRSAIEVIGEASKNISVPVKDEHREIPWHDMAGLRDRIIHGYFSIDYSIVWNVIDTDLPELEPKISALLLQLDEQ